MTHGEYLRRLILGFVGDSRVSRQPMHSGSDESDAVLRWAAYHCALYAMWGCMFEPFPNGRFVFIDINRVWSTWRGDDKEDVDIGLAGMHRHRYREHSCKLEVTRNFDEYDLRLNDWTSKRVYDVSGSARRGARLLINDSHRASNYPLHYSSSAAREDPGTTLLPECCVARLQQIGRIRTSLGLLKDVLTISKPLLFVLSVPKPGSKAIALSMRKGATNPEFVLRVANQGRGVTEWATKIKTSDWTLWKQAVESCQGLEKQTIRKTVDLHLIYHQGDPVLREFWSQMRGGL